MSAQPQPKESGLFSSTAMQLLITVVIMATFVVFGYYLGQLVGSTTFSTMSQTSGGLAITASLLQKMGFKTAAEIYNGTAIQAFGQANTAEPTDEMAFAGMMGLIGAIVGLTFFVNEHKKYNQPQQ
jgi:hypothetical protein